MYTSISRYLGTFNIYLYNLRTNETNLLWTLSFSQGREWKEGRITYNSQDKHKIIFEGIKGTGRGDIALDDITFFESSNCNILPSFALPNVTVTSPSTPTTPRTTSTTTYAWIAQSPYDCNFETDYCLWENDTTADFEWVRALASNAGTLSCNFILNLNLIYLEY